MLFAGEIRDFRCSSTAATTVCSVPIAGPCASQPCNAGACLNNGSSYTCDCPDTGLTGQNCDEDVLECAVNNGGCSHICEEQVGSAPRCSCPDEMFLGPDGHTCVGCEPGYTRYGSTCRANDCTDLIHCRNGGTCVGDAPNATCDCGAYYEGPLCYDDVLECATNNGGCPATTTCMEVVGGPPHCVCGEGLRFNTDHTACVPSNCSSADFPFELNGRWCVTEGTSTTMQWLDAQRDCSSKRGRFVAFATFSGFTQAMQMFVSAAVCTTSCYV